MQNESYDLSQIWAGPFRIFFVLTALAALWPVLAWMLLLTLGQTWPGHFSAAWHAHELLFGMVAAAAAGFLLTAIPHWTGCRPFGQRWLYALSAVWLAGRLVMFAGPAAAGGYLPAAVVAVVDGAFLPLLAAVAAQAIVRAGAWRNLPVAAVLLLWAVANGLMHSAWWGGWSAGLWRGEQLALDLLLILMVIIAGRITPAFSRNWLRLNCRPDAVVDDPARLRGLSLLALLALAASAQIPLAAHWHGLGALLAALLLAWRAWCWRGWRTRREPLLWILHLGWLWIVLSLIFRAGAALAGWPPSLAVHAVGAGAMGSLIIAVMTRVALGHTGRPLRLPRGAAVMYWLVRAAAVLRLAAAGLVPAHFVHGAGITALLTLAALAWVLSFALYLWFYWPILSRPRVDGLPG